MGLGHVWELAQGHQVGRWKPDWDSGLRNPKTVVTTGTQAARHPTQATYSADEN